METKVGIIGASVDHPSDDNPQSPGSESEAEVDGGTLKNFKQIVKLCLHSYFNEIFYNNYEITIS